MYPPTLLPSPPPLCKQVPTADMASQLLSKGGAAVSPRDRFILSRLNSAIRESNKALEEYQFGTLTQVWKLRHYMHI
jgi:valyl-tRNA synthetase